MSRTVEGHVCSCKEVMNSKGKHLYMGCLRHPDGPPWGDPCRRAGESPLKTERQPRCREFKDDTEMKKMWQERRESQHQARNLLHIKVDERMHVDRK